MFVKGLYGVVRHPQYFGIFLWTLGFAICGWRLVNYLMWLTLCYFYVLLAEHEEEELEAKFRRGYEEYKSKVAMVIPGLKVNVKPFLRVTAKKWVRLVIYTAIYVVLLTACYYLLSPLVVMYR